MALLRFLLTYLCMWVVMSGVLLGIDVLVGGWDVPWAVAGVQLCSAAILSLAGALVDQFCKEPHERFLAQLTANKQPWSKDAGSAGEGERCPAQPARPIAEAQGAADGSPCCSCCGSRGVELTASLCPACHYVSQGF